MDKIKNIKIYIATLKDAEEQYHKQEIQCRNKYDAEGAQFYAGMSYATRATLNDLSNILKIDLDDV